MNNLDIKTINLLEKIDNKQNYLFKVYPDSIDFKKVNLDNIYKIILKNENIIFKNKMFDNYTKKFVDGII